MEANISKWIKTLTAEEFDQAVSIVVSDCDHKCPAVKYCEAHKDDGLTCNQTFFNWARLEEE